MAGEGSKILECGERANLKFTLQSSIRNKRRNMREVISTPDAPKAIGPYSQAIRANGLVFVSGQVAIDPGTQQVIEGDVAVQTERVIRNLSAILNAAGSSLQMIVRSTVFLKNMGDFAAMNEVYGRHFTGAPPARSTVEAARLPKDVLAEIDVIALAQK
jgi:2-iminobutanoate/2-iminopropanoate deaminase